MRFPWEKDDPTLADLGLVVGAGAAGYPAGEYLGKILGGRIARSRAEASISPWNVPEYTGPRRTSWGGPIKRDIRKAQWHEFDATPGYWTPNSLMRGLRKARKDPSYNRAWDRAERAQNAGFNLDSNAPNAFETYQRLSEIKQRLQRKARRIQNSYETAAAEQTYQRYRRMVGRKAGATGRKLGGKIGKFVGIPTAVAAAALANPRLRNYIFG